MKKCVSCGMPLQKETTSEFSEIYCIYCQDQTNRKLASYEQVREGSIKAAMEFVGKTREEAEKMADASLPNLPRWKK